MDIIRHNYSHIQAASHQLFCLQHSVSYYELEIACSLFYLISSESYRSIVYYLATVAKWNKKGLWIEIIV